MATIKETVMQAMRTYLKAHCGTVLTNEQVIPINDVGPRPALPYLVVDVGVNVKVGSDEIWDTVVLGATYQTAKSQREVTVTVHGYGFDSEDWIETAAVGHNLPTQQKAFRDLDLTARPNGDILDLSAMLDSSIEYHFTQDWIIDIAWTSASQEQTEVLTFETEATAGDLAVDITTNP